jgi:Proliferating cell nuclear antigen, C-terminal domain
VIDLVDSDTLERGIPDFACQGSVKMPSAVFVRIIRRLVEVADALASAVTIAFTKAGVLGTIWSVPTSRPTTQRSTS